MLCCSSVVVFAVSKELGRTRFFMAQYVKTLEVKEGVLSFSRDYNQN